MRAHCKTHGKVQRPCSRVPGVYRACAGLGGQIICFAMIFNCFKENRQCWSQKHVIRYTPCLGSRAGVIRFLFVCFLFVYFVAEPDVHLFLHLCQFSEIIVFVGFRIPRPQEPKVGMGGSFVSAYWHSYLSGTPF